MKKENNFEQSIEKLEEIVNKLEQGNLNLDESIKLFEEGVLESKNCQKILDESQRKITKLVKTEDDLIEEDFKDMEIPNS